MRTIAILLVALGLRSGVFAEPLQAPPQDIGPVAKALDFLQIDYQRAANDGSLSFEVATEVYGRPGPTKLRLEAYPFTFGEDRMQFFQLQAYGIFSLSQSPHIDAARRTILEAGQMLATDVQFLYNGFDGLVTAQVAIPAPDGKVPAKLLRNYIDMVVGAIDRLDPVLDRASNSGFIDWPSQDRGPKQPEGELKVTPADGGSPFTVGWANWIEDRIFASTLVAFDSVLRKFSAMDDQQREAFGRELTGFGGLAGSNSFEGWMRLADHIEQQYPPIAFRFWGPPGTPVSATARIEGFCGDAVATGVIDGMGLWDVEVMPDWDIEALVDLEEPRTAVVEFTVECGGQRTSGSKRVTIAPISVADTGLGLMAVPQYVNEDHPWVRSIISEANTLGIAGSLGFTGNESFTDCVRQCFAIWTAMRNRGISYVSIAKNAEGGDDPNQTIRQFHEAICEQGANCADGAAAFASVLRKLGFEVWLIHPKGHVFVGVELPAADRDSDRSWMFLETTMLGEVEPDPVPADFHLAAAEGDIPERLRGENWGTFLAACKAGDDQIADGGVIEWVKLSTARKLGLRAIPAAGAALGRIPAAPKDLEALREVRREQKREERKVLDYVFALPVHPDCKPYATLEQLIQDIDAIETDPKALTRLLAAVDGDGAARFARVHATQDAILEPATAAAVKAFGSLPNRGYETFGVAGSPWQTEAQRTDNTVRILIKPLDKKTSKSWIDAREVDGRWVVTEESLSSETPWIVGTALTDIAERMRPGGLHELAESVAESVRSGKVKGPEGYHDLLWETIFAFCPDEATLKRLASESK